jgi:hypothetical protein
VTVKSLNIRLTVVLKRRTGSDQLLARNVCGYAKAKGLAMLDKMILPEQNRFFKKVASAQLAKACSNKITPETIQDVWHIKDTELCRTAAVCFLRTKPRGRATTWVMKTSLRYTEACPQSERSSLRPKKRFRTAISSSGRKKQPPALILDHQGPHQWRKQRQVPKSQSGAPQSNIGSG